MICYDMVQWDTLFVKQLAAFLIALIWITAKLLQNIYGAQQNKVDFVLFNILTFNVAI